MKSLKNLIEKVFPNAQSLPVGVYHYQAPPEAAFPYRLHLRIESDGSGLLIINASTVLHLNRTAAEYAYYLVQQKREEEAIDQIVKRYNVLREQAQQDYHEFIDRLQILIETPDLDPVTYLDFGRKEPYAGAVSAPYRLDCALTYRVSDEGAKDVAPKERVSRELLTAEWRQILSKAWEAGIPHVVFTGGEPTLRPDLPEIIAVAEELGQVTGVLTNGLRLAEHNYLQRLLNSGLDHLMIILDPQEEQSWEALRDALTEDVHVTVHLTISRRVKQDRAQLLDRLMSMGVTTLSLSVDDLSLLPELENARQLTADRHIQLVWDLPVPYSRSHPVALELEADKNVTEGAGLAWMYVEPDGDVLRCQGQPEVLGNLLSDSWSEIWEKVKAAC